MSEHPLTIVLGYIDPGTGGLLISALIGLGMTLLFTLKGLIYKISALISGKSYRGHHDFSDKLVFFSESKNYWNVFKPVIENMIKLNHDFIYLSADKEDPGLKLNNPNCEAIFIGKMQQAIFFLKKIKAKMCVTTTPQLDVIALKRSPNVKHYCYLSHAPMDVHANKLFSFDYYDSVLCGSIYHIKNLRQLENDRKSKAKILMETGCTYFDEYKSENAIDGNYILLAPTWGERSFLHQGINILIQSLLKGDDKIIFRPHPQSWVSDREILTDIEDKFGDHKSFEIDRSTDNSKALAHAHTLICDISSGIIFDAAFVYKKAIIAIEFEWNDGGYESSDLNEDASTKHLIKEVGNVIIPKDFPNIIQYVKSAQKKEVTEDIINKHIFNFRNAGPVAADQIITIFNNLN